MNITQRSEVRLALITQGFKRDAYGNDHSGVGDYSETFVHPDGDVVEIRWSPKSPTVAPSNATDVRALTDATQPEDLILAATEAATDDDAEALLLAASEADEDDIEFARDTLGPNATEDEVRDLAEQRAVRDLAERRAARDGDDWCDDGGYGSDADLPSTPDVTDAPGMYDEPDDGLTFSLPISDEEDRIR